MSHKGFPRQLAVPTQLPPAPSSICLPPPPYGTHLFAVCFTFGVKNGAWDLWGGLQTLEHTPV